MYAIRSYYVVEALGDFIEGGRLKLYCTESNVAEAWTRRETDPRWRIRRHMAYEKFIAEELAPWIRQDCRSAGHGLPGGGVPGLGPGSRA